MEDEYSAKDIIVLSGIQGVRKRPAMYIGSTGNRGFIHLLYEVLDNSIDEALAGFCKNIIIKLSKDGDVDVAEVSDDGRGIPVDILPKQNKPALEVIMTSLHTGAKFENKIYKVSGGLHGVGLTVVNALSEYVEVKVKKNGKVYKQTFSRGAPTSGLEIVGDSGNETGTSLKFKPDMEIFQSNSFDTLLLKQRLADLAFLNPKISIKLIDGRAEEIKEDTYYSERGLVDFLDHVKGKNEPLSKPIFISREMNPGKVEVVFQYVNSYNEELYSFVNNIRTGEGGTHVSGFHSAITRAILNYAENNKSNKKGNLKLPNIQGEDTREGLIGVVLVLMQNPEFEGQTKEKLGNSSIKNLVETAVYEAFLKYLEENPSESAIIIAKVTRTAEAREAAKRARELVRSKNAFGGSILPGKLADCTEDDPSKSEIFIVEGDSAAGSSKQGRDRMYQAILPLKGKVLNVEKAIDEKIFANNELRALSMAIGTGIGDAINIEKLRYHKIILLTDADVDGSHIKTLLLTFFFRYMKILIEKGYIYIANPPLYKVNKGKEIKYAYSDNELNKIVKEYEGKATVQRYKGLGEMNPEQLWETTLNQDSRILKKVLIKDAEMANSIFLVLMGVDVKERRRFIEEHSTEVSFLDV